MGMKLRSTAPESALVHVCETDSRPLCEHCGKPVNTDCLMDPAHDDCWEGMDSKFEPKSLLELWADCVDASDFDVR